MKLCKDELKRPKFYVGLVLAVIGFSLGYILTARFFSYMFVQSIILNVIGALAFAIAGFQLVYIGDDQLARKAEMEKQAELDEQKKKFDLSKCTSCAEPLNEGQNYCTACGFDNAKIRSKLKG